MCLSLVFNNMNITVTLSLISSLIVIQSLLKDMFVLIYIVPLRSHAEDKSPIFKRLSILFSFYITAIFYLLSAIFYQLFSISYFLSSISYLLSVIFYQLSSTSYFLSSTSYLLSAISYLLGPLGNILLMI